MYVAEFQKKNLPNFRFLEIVPNPFTVMPLIESTVIEVKEKSATKKYRLNTNFTSHLKILFAKTMLQRSSLRF